jgi:hypothetical protein
MLLCVRCYVCEVSCGVENLLCCVLTLGGKLVLASLRSMEATRNTLMSVLYLPVY